VTIRDGQLPVPVWRRTKAVFVSGFIRRPIGGPICLLWTQGRIIAVISVPPGDPPSRLVRPTLLAIQYPGVYTVAIPDVSRDLVQSPVIVAVNLVRRIQMRTIGIEIRILPAE